MPEGREAAPPTPPSAGRPDHFPDATELVRGMLTSGREIDAVRYVMECYRPALAAYFSGSSFRHRFPADESAESAVDQFFGDQMARQGFLSSWLAARSRFRYWLLVSFVNHMRHRLRREQSEIRRRDRARERLAKAPRDMVRDQFDAEMARGLVRSAAKLAQETCVGDGRGDDWETFARHYLEERSYNEIAAQEGLTYRQVANRVRFAQKRLVEALTTVLAANGVTAPTEVRRELARLLEALERCRS